MLSPAASLELSTEAQRHQKRVKEEGEAEDSSEEGDDSKQTVREKEERQPTGRKLDEEKTEQLEVAETTVKVETGQALLQRKAVSEKEGEKPTGKTSKKKEEVSFVQEQVARPSTPSYPSLNTSTSVNWCYLHYVKPNPSALREPSTSVYSTWSVSAHNPNLPGLSTKVALSLLCSKQKYSSETYTMATAPVPAKSKISPVSSRTQQVSEVKFFILPPYP